MPELVRFQIARAVQRSRPALPALAVGTSETVAGWLDGEATRGRATEFLAVRGLVRPARRYSATGDLSGVLEQVRRFSDHLTDLDNDPDPDELTSYLRTVLDGTAEALVQRWAPLRRDLDAALVAVVISDAEVDLRVDVMRLTLVLGILDVLVVDTSAAGDAPEEDDGGNGSRDGNPAPAAVDGGPRRTLLAEALRSRTVTLPERLVDAVGGPHSILARPPGAADLWVVRDEWARYEAGEIAHVENVLAHESKLRLLDKTTETETTETTDENRTTVVEQDSRATSRFELARESQRDADLAVHVEGQVDTSGQYGPTKVTTHLGGSLDYSVKEASKQAVKQARESVTRAVSRVEETVRRQRVERSLTRVREADQHKLDNDSDRNISGIYRWVDKVQRLQMFRYPNRLLFEFQIPEPGSFVRWMAARPMGGIRAPKPAPFTKEGTDGGTDLVPDAIGANPDDAGRIHYQTLAARYFATGIEQPPEPTVVYTTMTNPDPETDVVQANKVPSYTTGTVAIPDGYQGVSLSVYVVGTNAGSAEPDKLSVWYEVVVGTDFPSRTGDRSDPDTIWRFSGPNVFRGLQSFDFRKPVTGTVPVLLGTDDSSGGLVGVEVRCEPTERTVAEWRQKVYDSLSAAYWEMRNQYEDEIAQREVRAGIDIQGDSPVRNKQRVRDELRKFTLEMLAGERFAGRPAMTLQDLDPGPQDVPVPAVDLAAAREAAAHIQFLEQAFEWENLTYILYPYFWADSRRWPEISNLTSADPDFDEFLRAGSARVVLSARPGFEAQASLYTLFGVLWGGGPVPAPGDDLYLSVAEEIRAQQRPITDGEPGEWWEVRLPTTLLYLEPTGTTLPLENTGARLPAGPARAEIGAAPALWTGTAHQEAFATLETDQVDWIAWPPVATWQVAVPEWATHAGLTFLLNPGVATGDVWGELRVDVGGVRSSPSMFDVNYEADGGNKPEQATLLVSDDLAVPPDLRGRTVTVTMEARMRDPQNCPGHLEAYRGCHVNGQLAFRARG